MYGFEIREQKYGMTPINLQSTLQGTKDLGDWIGTWNKRDWLIFIEVSSGLLAMIPSPASPFLLAISTTAGFVNAKAAWDEGHHYEAGLMFTFSLLGAATVYRILKFSKTYRQLGNQGSIKLMEKVVSGTASTVEKSTAKKLVEEIGPYADELSRETSKEIIRRTIKNLSKKGLKYLVKFFISILKIGKFVVREGVVIAGTFLSYDKIYQALNYKDEQAMKERRHDPLVKIYNLVMNNEEEIIKQMYEQFEEEILPKVLKNPEQTNKVLNIRMDDSVKFPKPK